MLVIIIALVISSYYFSSISVVEVKVYNAEKTRAALLQAKKALINYAVTHADGNGGGIPGEYGYLPCPDSTAASTEGNQDPTCGARFKNRLGYLPWRSLDLPVLKDGSGSCLWYAVSGNYKGENASGLVNEDTSGLFQLVDENGNLLDSDLAAVILAPGVALSGQIRDLDNTTHCGEDYGSESAYLEGDGVIDNSDVPDVVDSVDQFINATMTSPDQAIPFNDQLITVKHSEIWQAIMRRDDINNRLAEVTEALAQCLAAYVNDGSNPNRRFPWPAEMSLGGGDYREMTDYEDVLNAASGYAGRFPFYPKSSNVVIGLPVNNMIEMGFCNNLLLLSGDVVDLQTAGSEHKIILNNWKDHFFYAVSKDYAVPNVAHTGCTGDCVRVGGAAPVAAVVFYSASPYAGQLRAIADKPDIDNYLENNNNIVFPDPTGGGVYTTTDPDPLISNDIMFCLTDNPVPTVIAC